MNTGTITEIIGPVVDVHFEKDRPAIQEALVIEAQGEHKRIVLEVGRTLRVTPPEAEVVAVVRGSVRHRTLLL